MRAAVRPPPRGTHPTTRRSLPTAVRVRVTPSPYRINGLRYGTGLASSTGMVEVCPDREPSRTRSLFIAQDGLLEPVGASQILPYVCAIGDAGVSLRVLSFETSAALSAENRVAETRELLAGHGVTWAIARRHERPRVAAAGLDLVIGVLLALRLALKESPRIVHGRGYFAGAIAWCVKLACGSRLIFDMRGFWPEERVELGRFRPTSLRYRLAKRLEQRLWEDADHVVVLTERARVMLHEHGPIGAPRAQRQPSPPISVIPCCADLTRFTRREPDPTLTRHFTLDDSFVIGNIGAVNDRYLLSEMFRFAFHLKALRPTLRFIYLTHENAAGLETIAQDAGLLAEDLLVTASTPEDIPRWLPLFKLGVFFLRPSHAAKASCYPKLAEFLAAGVPVVTNPGVGDVDAIVSSGCGILVRSLKDDDLALAAKQSLRFWQEDSVSVEVRDSCRQTAATHLGLELATKRYRDIYDALTTTPQADEISAGAGPLVTSVGLSPPGRTGG